MTDEKVGVLASGWCVGDRVVSPKSLQMQKDPRARGGTGAQGPGCHPPNPLSFCLL